MPHHRRLLCVTQDWRVGLVNNSSGADWLFKIIEVPFPDPHTSWEWEQRWRTSDREDWSPAALVKSHKFLFHTWVHFHQLWRSVSDSQTEHLSCALGGEGGTDKSDNLHLQSLLDEHISSRVVWDTWKEAATNSQQSIAAKGRQRRIAVSTRRPTEQLDKELDLTCYG